jgi:hypothetical protein
MSEQRFTIQKASGMYLHLPIFDNDVEMADGDVCILLNEQQANINILLEELINAQNQGYVVDFLHKNGRCNLTPKELENE